MPKLKVYQGKVNRRTTVPVKQQQAFLDQWQDFDGKAIDSKHLLISMLLPPAVKEFMRELDSEVRALCGSRYEHGTENQRWGAQPGSITLANQKVRIKKPRVRSALTKKELPLTTYDQFQDSGLFDEQVFTEGLKKVSQRDFKEGLPKIAASFGFTKSSVSRRWVKATEKKLTELNTRDLGKLGIVAVLIDGKRFSSRGVVIAMGIGLDGKKTVLGIYECSTENSAACQNLLSDLEARGLAERELLFVVDGGSGLNKALEDRYDIDKKEARRAVRVRCFVHKWWNLEKNISDECKGEAAGLFWGIRDAQSLDVAIGCADALEAVLYKDNQSALKSFREAREDLLMLQRLRIGASLKKFFSSTNAIESLNYLSEEDLRRVKKWRDSGHFQRWIATSVLRSEKRMHRVRGHQGLVAMKVALSNLCHKETTETLDDEVQIA